MKAFTLKMKRDKSIFRFKKFSVQHQNSNMKVGTDGVLLGAWGAQHFTPKNILDVGTGSGLISLLLAQRFQEAKIIGIDIHLPSIQDALANKNNFPLPHQLSFKHIDLIDFTTTQKFDLIVSNPPYFSTALLSHQSHKNAVRHQIHLTIEQLISKSSALLTPNGKIALILPTNEMNSAIEMAKAHQLHTERVCYIRSFADQPVIRLMAEFSFNEIEEMREEQLIIYQEKNMYSEAYKNLTRDFYLKF